MMHGAHTKDRLAFGFWLYLMSDAVLFATLFACYAVYSKELSGGPSPAELFSLPFVVLESLVLLTSSLTAGLALFALRLHKTYAALTMLFATLLLGALFLALELYEFGELIHQGAGPDTNAFLSSFFTLIGTHGLHVFVGLIWLTILIAHLSIRGLSEETKQKLMCWGLYWHFLDLIWIFIFTFVYLFGFI
jgi:cytochrome o ubiquinol oxidase subunit III